MHKINRSEVSNLPNDIYSGNYIIEEFVNAPVMVTCDGYTIGDKISRFSVHEYDKQLLQSFSEPYLILRTSHFYESNPQIINDLKAESQKALKTLLRNKSGVNPFHFEWFVSSDGKPIFNEVGRRFGGGNLTTIIESEYGVNLLKEYWELETSNTNTLTNIKPKEDTPNNLTATFMPYKKKGKIISLPQQQDFDWTYETRILSKIGDTSNGKTTIVTDIPFISTVQAQTEDELQHKIKRLINLSKKVVYKKVDNKKK
ncbi:hypothetical protein [Fructilactobacillus fructivorans]|uniref:Biotin carboxylase n=1 Tax=Fructilactobacillus fructivorans TaxID=1614 RepID=A0A0C1LZP8_9LACO|nr:hypothetical protein [Fructilactobacillus fructivorans]KID42350.1 Biotin carboxylase [Fructilactobacillus fructivorans]MCT0151033.1 hypothetical protein [Fructilactobacillus fructivorans]MCT2867409.1 hypothetical protein [Fructilactobacillus fructivorans]MCT2869072.1 hypothetical protein [Fructilactobacillus fructivorans]MCT2873208.1 hypothetical protein [Fructilactobacillus fructivorans]